MNKEQAYDSKINPLMAQIIEICQAHKISMFATFDIPTEEDDGLACTTCLADESGKPSERIREINGVAMRGRAPTMHLRTIHADGSETRTAFLE